MRGGGVLQTFNDSTIINTWGQTEESSSHNSTLHIYSSFIHCNPLLSSILMMLVKGGGGSFWSSPSPPPLKVSPQMFSLFIFIFFYNNMWGKERKKRIVMWSMDGWRRICAWIKSIYGRRKIVLRRNLDDFFNEYFLGFVPSKVIAGLPVSNL